MAGEPRAGERTTLKIIPNDICRSEESILGKALGKEG